MPARLKRSISGAVRKLGEQVLSEKVLRPAAHAGAKVFYDELRVRVPVDKGVLQAAVYRWHDPQESKAEGRQVYHVGVNKRKAPHWHLIEFGHWRVNVVMRLPNGQVVATKERLPQPVWVPAHPYLRPTYDSQAHRAIQAMKDRLRETIAEAQRGGAPSQGEPHE